MIITGGLRVPGKLLLLIPAVFLFIVAGSIADGQIPGSATVKKCADFNITGDGSSDSWQVKVLYSVSGIYFLFKCEDGKLTATMKHDNMDLWNEDVVEVFLWTDEEFPVYFEYEISPLDHELPIMVPNYRGKFLGWLPWHYEGDRKVLHATKISGGKRKPGSRISGWSAEFFIPWKLLAPLNKVPPTPGTRWRANLYRIDHDSGVSPFSWQKTRGTFHDYNSFGTFVFE
jgi:hypothetical protein